MIYMLGAICLCVVSGRFLNRGYMMYIRKTGVVNMVIAGANAIIGVIAGIYSYMYVDDFVTYMRGLL